MRCARGACWCTDSGKGRCYRRAVAALSARMWLTRRATSPYARRLGDRVPATTKRVEQERDHRRGVVRKVAVARAFVREDRARVQLVADRVADEMREVITRDEVPQAWREEPDLVEFPGGKRLLVHTSMIDLGGDALVRLECPSARGPAGDGRSHVGRETSTACRHRVSWNRVSASVWWRTGPAAADALLRT